MQQNNLTGRRAHVRCSAAVVGALLALFLVGGSSARAGVVSAIGTDNPADVITSVARSFLTDIATHRDQYRTDSAKLDNLARAVVLPHFDSKLAARLVLARHWDDAGVEQRRRFVDAFYYFLLHNFGADLVDFSLSRLQVLPYRGDPDATYAEVRTLVRRRNGDLVHVDYSLHHSKQGWKIYDVAFEGISYLTSFRGDFAEEIQQKGLDELISRLQSEYAGAATKTG